MLEAERSALDFTLAGIMEGKGNIEKELLDILQERC